MSVLSSSCLATSQAVSHGLTDNGALVWHLPPGGYTIAGFNYHVGTSGRIMAHFTVPPGTPLLYVGTLEIRMRSIVSYRTGVLGCLLFLASCSTTFHSLKAQNPPVGDPRFPRTAESTQPTFKWSPSPEPEATYDLIVYECVETFGKWGGIYRVPGKEVYLRTAIEGAEHRIEVPLKPGMKYYWSVRRRIGDTVGPWSRYDYFLFLGVGIVQANNQLFLFRTPE